MKDKIMLIETAMEMMKEDLYSEYYREIREDDHLNHNDFMSNKARVQKGFRNASERAINMCSLAVARHREYKHEDDNIIEQESLIKSLSEEEVETASASASWRV